MVVAGCGGAGLVDKGPEKGVFTAGSGVHSGLGVLDFPGTYREFYRRVFQPRPKGFKAPEVFAN